MPRKARPAKREVLADPIYNSKTITKLINKMMKGGKKQTSESILYSAFNIVAEQTGREPLEVFQEAMDNIQPLLEVKSTRIGGTNYQIPMEVSEERKETLALRWLVNYSRLRNEKSMDLRLAREIMDAANGTGASVKKKEDTHRMAEANKAFAHYRR
ncbi:30S ribosomal protein S7 [Mollicutes bacterium LVI A0078]|nr:30S ribosomal protein S7 [Mollicutes bacterium LVI A0075]WOO90619.1 30S ribosomal protein S7 [Mollicutes bacterium LVI A0078]